MTELINFVIKFFNNLGSEIKQDGERLVISCIPQNFEKFSGKNGPYFLSFDGEKEGYEVVSPSHYLIKAIREFLEDRGGTTLLKINFLTELKEEIPKIIPFLNAEIKNINKTAKNNFIFKFSFATTFQYFNEKETAIHHIFVKDNEVINWDESLILVEGNKRDVQEVNADKEYSISREELKKMILPKTDELKNKLGEKLENEIAQIHQLYEKNISEIEAQEESLKKQAKANKDDLEKAKKIARSLENMKEENNKKKIKDEEEEFIQKEIKKHGLKIENKLINTTIIYFPVYHLNLTLEIEKNNYKIIELDYDPFKKKILPIYCKSCGEELKEIILCSSGHLTCRNCGEKCASCGKIYCKSCQTKICSECGRVACQHCQNTCEVCGKVFCSTHIINNSGRKVCRICNNQKSQITKFNFKK
jgi:hypothetical protein